MQKVVRTTFFDDIINIKNFDPHKTKIDQKSYKYILIYYIGYVTVKILIFISYTVRKTIFPKSWNIMESSKRPSKYHLSINFLAEKKTVFPISEKFKTRTFQ